MRIVGSAPRLVMSGFLNINEITNANVKAGFNFIPNGVEEKNLYYYHPDHLGSSSYITNKEGNIVQHTEYIAFGETFVDEHSVNPRQPYLFNGKELDFETGLYYYGARYYDAKTSLWLNVDPLAEKYPEVSPYTYVANNPIGNIDPDGRRIYFVAGAGNDSDGWNYVNRFKSIWTSLGIKDFRRVNASHGKVGDISFVNKFRNKQFFWTNGEFTAPKQHFATENKQYQRALKSIINDLKKNPLKEGEQLNLTGYSYGAVLQEHLAIGLADEGYKIDNLILIGSPTSDGSDLMNKLQDYQKAGKIGNIIRHDIEGDLLSNPKTEGQFIKGGIQNSFLGDGDNGAHFDLARPEKEANKKIKQLGQKLQRYDVK